MRRSGPHLDSAGRLPGPGLQWKQSVDGCPPRYDVTSVLPLSRSPPWGPWAEHFDLITDLPGRGGTVVGNDGAIIATGAVVTGDARGSTSPDPVSSPHASRGRERTAQLLCQVLIPAIQLPPRLEEGASVSRGWAAMVRWTRSLSVVRVPDQRLPVGAAH